MSDIAAEMARRQKLADDRDADPTLADTWQGSTTQSDIDSHQFSIEEGCGVFCGGDCESEWCNCCGDCCDCMPIDDDGPPSCTGFSCPGGCDND